MKHMNGWWCPDVLSGPGKFLRRSEVIGYALRYWHGPKRRVIQAGAHIGIWPRMLAQYFEAVVCLEPEPANWECLMLNTKDSPRITCVRGLLGAQQALLAPLSVQPHSSGGHHVATRYDRDYTFVGQYAIDDWGYDDVDAIFLDTEGCEIPILHGARDTIQHCKPLLVCEENSCCQRYGFQRGELQKWLMEEYYYKEVGTYGEDSIFLPES